MPLHVYVRVRVIWFSFVLIFLLTFLASGIWFLIIHYTPIALPYYCSPELCAPGQRHVGCDGRRKFSAACIAPKQIKFSNGLKRLTVNHHNILRDKFAAGKIKPHPSAARMATVIWHDELAQLAFLNTQRCAMHYDECRNTKKYRHVGQNTMLSEPYKSKAIRSSDVDHFIIKTIELWFSQYNQASLLIMQNFQVDASSAIHDFANIVYERTTKVGCGMTGFFSRRRRLVYLFTCNYNSEPRAGLPVYVVGPPASKCKTGNNKKFKSLCSRTEPFSEVATLDNSTVPSTVKSN